MGISLAHAFESVSVARQCGGEVLAAGRGDKDFVLQKRRHRLVVIVVPRLDGEDHAGAEHGVVQRWVAGVESDMMAEVERRLHVGFRRRRNCRGRDALERGQCDSRACGGDHGVGNCTYHLHQFALARGEMLAHRERAPNITDVVLALAPDVKNHHLAACHRAIASIVVRTEDTPRPQRVTARLDNRGKGRALRAEGHAVGDERARERALVDASGNARRTARDRDTGDAGRFTQHRDLAHRLRHS